MTDSDPKSESADLTLDETSVPTGLDEQDERGNLFGRLLVFMGFADQTIVDEAWWQSKADPQTPFAVIMVRRVVISDQQRFHIDKLLEGAEAIDNSSTVSLNQPLLNTTIAIIPKHDDGISAGSWLRRL